jgi:hypothetical protein
MDKIVAELRRIRGVGGVVAARLAAAGLDSYDKIAAAGEVVLKGIRGINPATIPAILAQAAELAAKAAEDRVCLLRDRAVVLNGRVTELSAQARLVHGAELAGRVGDKIEREFCRIASALECAAATTRDKKWIGKRLAKAEKRLVAIDETSLKSLHRSLKKTRKALKKFR